MPVFHKLVDFDDTFHKLPHEPIIINDIVDSSEEDKENIKDIITTRYNTDMLSLIPSCRCGKTKGEFSKQESKCEYCGTPIKSIIEDDIIPNIWFRRPKGVNKLIKPIVWIMLRKRFSKSGFCILSWLVDTDYKTNIKQPPVLSKIIQSGIQRGYNNFVDNFDTIINYLFSLKEFKVPKNEPDYLKLLIDENRNIIFSDYLPLPNKSLLIIEKTNVGVYSDRIIVEAKDAILMLVSIDASFYDQNPKVKENRTIRALTRLCNFYENFFKVNLAPKAGLFRKNILGTRTDSSFRAVISSITGVHRDDEIHIPWAIGLTVLEPMILNRLFKLGYDLNSSKGLILGHVEKYHPLLDQIMIDLINETPQSLGIPCIALRNPSLLSG